MEVKMMCGSWFLAIIFIAISPTIVISSLRAAASDAPADDANWSLKSSRRHRHRHQPAHHIDRQFIADDSSFGRLAFADNERGRSPATHFDGSGRNAARSQNRKNSQRRVQWQKHHKNGNSHFETTFFNFLIFSACCNRFWPCASKHGVRATRILEQARAK